MLTYDSFLGTHRYPLSHNPGPYNYQTSTPLRTKDRNMHFVKYGSLINRSCHLLFTHLYISDSPSTCYSAAAITIIRTTKLPADLQKNADVVHQFVLFFIWNSLEVNILIISCCVPTLKPLCQLVRGRKLSKHARVYPNSHKSYDSKRSYALSSIGQSRAMARNRENPSNSS